MKRILALDGGGIRGVFSLEILLRMESLLREHYGKPDLVLADHFDLFAGTSTGAIIATGLCWGMPVEEILDMYVTYGRTMFTPVPWWRPIKKLLMNKFEAQPLSDFLQRIFSENGDGAKPAMLDSPRLRKGLLVVVRNHTTGSAWPLTNNPDALYNDVTKASCNLKIPLYKLVRASTAAPTYFEPEQIVLDGKPYIFVDGSITPYNNPALIAAQTAILPCYRMNWPAGPDNLRVVSVGTMRFSTALPEKAQKLWLGYNAAKIPAALMQGVAWQQDFLCRCLGECLYGEELDGEIRDMIGETLPGRRWFSYVRYNQTYKADKLEEILRIDPRIAGLDAVGAIPALSDVGRAYAEQNVQLEHLI